MSKQNDDVTGLLVLIARIRWAVGDPAGELMQDKLVERCSKLHDSHADLLAFVEAFIRAEDANTSNDVGYGPDTELYRQARAALAKAKGE